MPVVANPRQTRAKRLATDSAPVAANPDQQFDRVAANGSIPTGSRMRSMPIQPTHSATSCATVWASKTLNIEYIFVPV